MSLMCGLSWIAFSVGHLFSSDDIYLGKMDEQASERDQQQAILDRLEQVSTHGIKAAGREGVESDL